MYTTIKNLSFNFNYFLYNYIFLYFKNYIILIKIRNIHIFSVYKY